MFYLGNFKIDDTIQNDVEQASKIIKRDIRFLNEPMPTVRSPQTKDADKYKTGFGSIAVFDGKKDCSKFWIEFNRIRSGK
jgi:hypothetical protein